MLDFTIFYFYKLNRGLDEINSSALFYEAQLHINAFSMFEL